MEQIHGHTILDWLGESPRPLTLSELESRTLAEFGTMPHFKTCSSEGHTLSELMAVLEERGKVVCRDGAYLAHAHLRCKHE